MLIKNRNIIFILILFLSIFVLNFKSFAEEFNITAKEIFIDKDQDILIGKGSVKAIDNQGKIILADKITYKKESEFLIAEGNVLVDDKEGNILKSDKATYDKINEVISTYNNTELEINEGYKLLSKNILYNVKNKILNTNNDSVLTDLDGNTITSSMFQYDINNNLFSSVGEINITDVKNNKYYFKEIHVDTKKKEMIGSDISVVLDKKTFGVSEESDPRFISNDIYVSKNTSIMNKGVFTVCKKEDNKCPPWSLRAKKIRHEKAKKTIYYEHAILKLYDFPIFYFPRFFHPDPTVKRQSGFLAPIFSTSSAMGNGFGLPYFWAIDKDKDITLTQKYYSKENMLFLNEYRQAFANGFLTLDTSFNEGYKNNTAVKTKGSRNHLFANLDLNLNQQEAIDSNLSIKIQRTSNDTYLRVHDIDTTLVDSENTILENEIKYSFSNEDSYFNVATSAYEDLREKKKSDKYEYILPNVTYGKTFLTKNFVTLNFSSNALVSSYKTNKHKAILTNDLVMSPISFITKKGFKTSFEGMFRNTNYEVKKVDNFKRDKTINELHSVVAYKTSLPMKKEGVGFSNFFSPNMMIRYSPGQVRNLSNEDIYLNYNNLYSLNKTTEIEDGLSAILGFDYKVNKKMSKNVIKETLAVSLGQVFNYEENKDMPSKSSLDQKTSDVVGKIDYNFSKIGKINYNFALDDNLSDLNSNEIATELNFGKVQFNLDYLEQRKHVGEEHYASSGVSLNFDDNNKLSFNTKRNFKTESTELYDLSYQYEIDCLTAGVIYRREFYHDVDDLEKKNSLMFTIRFVPFGQVNTPKR